jgi:SAM-dependent methyltransferase
MANTLLVINREIEMMKTYSDFGLTRSISQILFAFRSRRDAQWNMSLLYAHLLEHEKMIADKLGKPVKNLRILEIGLGQGMERARYFGIHNQVTGMDLDVLPTGLDPRGYLRLIKTNGFGRFLKTVGRRMIIAGPNRAAWSQVVGENGMHPPQVLTGDICHAPPEEGAYEVVMSWSVFEHLSDPQSALQNVIDALRPGGVLFISIHLYTANNGHHDIRAFTGQEDLLPPWGHLRPATQNLLKPSSYLNRWRLDHWRDLFSQLAPGYNEHLETQNSKYASLMTEELRQELLEFSDEELLTIDAIYTWRKPV